jgi:hypothetical protein
MDNANVLMDSSVMIVLQRNSTARIEEYILKPIIHVIVIQDFMEATVSQPSVLMIVTIMASACLTVYVFVIMVTLDSIVEKVLIS